MIRLALLFLLSSCGYGYSASMSVPGPRPPGGYMCRSDFSPDVITCFPEYGRPRHCHIWAGRWVCR